MTELKKNSNSEVNKIILNKIKSNKKRVYYERKVYENHSLMILKFLILLTDQSSRRF